MISIPAKVAAILKTAAQSACPGLIDPISVTAEKKKDWEYVSPSAMKFFNMHKKKGSFGYATCQDMATAIVDNVAEDNGVIEKIELAQMGQGLPEKAGFFLNIYLT